MENLKLGDRVIVRTRQGMEYGEIVSIDKIKEEQVPSQIDGLILQKMTEEDEAKVPEIEKAEKKILEISRKEILKQGVNMKIIEAEYMFDMKKIILYFLAIERVDFKDFLPGLIEKFNVWVEMRQVSARECARIQGGIGICGQNLCCSSFLSNFQNIHIQSALEQGIVVNSSKLCGVCGRLMCCLKYEEQEYKESILKE
jgi:cell fate regulator YaaT (PSP1 superfamily)